MLWIPPPTLETSIGRRDMNEADILGYVQEPVKRVPVLYDADVAVAGSGTASTVSAHPGRGLRAATPLLHPLR